MKQNAPACAYAVHRGPGRSFIHPIKSTFKFISVNILSFFSPCFKVKILSFIALYRKVLPRLSQKSCMDTTISKLSCSSQKIPVFLQWTLCYNDARNTEKQKEDADFMKRRKFLSLMGTTALASGLLLTGCGKGAGSDDRRVIRIGHVQ